jgi:hypothetical protein
MQSCPFRQIATPFDAPNCPIWGGGVGALDVLILREPKFESDSELNLFPMLALQNIVVLRPKTNPFCNAPFLMSGALASLTQQTKAITQSHTLGVESVTCDIRAPFAPAGASDYATPPPRVCLSASRPAGTRGYIPSPPGQSHVPSFPPSPVNRGVGWGGGRTPVVARNPLPNPPPDYRGRGKKTRRSNMPLLSPSPSRGEE